MACNNPYEEGCMAGLNATNPYRTHVYQALDREDRMDREVSGRRWQAGAEGRPDPYPDGWAG
jgi:hypothetical protein